MLRVCTGENRILSGALIRHAGEALARTDAPLYVVVPRQLTLFTERLLLDGLKLQGSFRLRVISPARLCSLIFEAAGAPGGTRIDERGRVMLVRRAIRNSENLTIYKNADRRRGFAERCARQLELLMQGGVSPEDLRACAGDARGMTRMKLSDLAALLEEYSALTAGQYQDGETELIEAALRVRKADFVSKSRFCFFGFDFMPPTLTRLIAELSATGAASALFFPLPNDEQARDYDTYRPLERALLRISAACREAGTEMQREKLAADENENEILRLSRELYAYPAEPFPGETGKIRIDFARDMREECMLAAARARSLAMQGMRYGEMQLLCSDTDAYRPLLIEAFRLYEVPLFLSESRPVSRMATAECLLCALKLVERGFRCEDINALMRTGYMDLSRDEADRLSNYAFKRGIDGARWLRPFVRGSDAEIAELEPLRKRLMVPLTQLRTSLREAKTLKAQLAALFGFMTEISAYEKSLSLQRELMQQGMQEAAAALSQAWNRIIGALDQMAALMGEGRLSLRELSQTLSEALEAAVVKPLPQSGDAVFAQSAGRMLMQHTKALFVLGMSDRSASGEDGLLTSAQKQLLAEKTKAYLGPDESDAARIRRLYLKSALGMASEAVFISCPLSGADGSALRPGAEIDLIREIFPALSVGGGMQADEDLDKLLCNAPMAALSRNNLLPELRSLDMPALQDRLRRLGRMQHTEGREGIDPASARELYGKLQYQSITRLERFANCPFSYFIAYGLKPERIEPFEFSRRDAGSFLHAAVNEFLRSCASRLNSLAPDAAEAIMDGIAAHLLEGLQTGTPMEDSASARGEERALRATACRCARVLTEHMQGSKFHTRQLERSFGREDGCNQLTAGGTILEGRIDRVDEWEEGNSLRVIDFKLGGKALNLAGAYHGLQLQLPVYLGAALSRRNARSAGVYFFPLDEGIVNTQSTDPRQVEKERAKEFRMSGLLPEDIELIQAQSPNPDTVFHARFTNGGALWSDVPRADDKNFDRLIRHTVRMAEKQLADIRSGETAVSPASFDKRDGCAYCDYRAACLFDPRLDGAKVRRLKNLKWNEVFEKLALEDDTAE